MAACIPALCALAPASAPAVAARTTFTADTRAQVDGNRVFRHVDDTWARGGWRARPKQGPGRVEALGTWSARWNRMVVTARSDARGRLAVALTAPKQLCDPEDTVEFKGLRVVAH